jgi:Nucleotidyl transferase AbiEii toxin, Type IV TA system
LIGYPIETVLAEKLVTMIDRGDTTTRDRDFADVVLLIARHRIHAGPLAGAIAATARHRCTPLRPLGETLATLAADRQNDWNPLHRTRGPPRRCSIGLPGDNRASDRVR